MADEIAGMVIERLARQVAQLEKRVAQLEHQESVGGGPISTANIAAFPSDGQLDAAFGVPADISKGMLKWVNDNGAETAVFGAVPVGSSWWYWQLTKAV